MKSSTLLVLALALVLLVSFGASYVYESFEEDEQQAQSLDFGDNESAQTESTGTLEAATLACSRVWRNATGGCGCPYGTYARREYRRRCKCCEY